MSSERRAKKATKPSNTSPAQAPHASTSAKARVTKEKLLRILDFSTPLSDDLSVVLGYYHDTQIGPTDADFEKAEAKENYILKSADYKQWLSGGSKLTSLFIVGNIDEACAISFLSAAMAMTLEKMLESQEAITIGYFCGTFSLPELAEEDSRQGLVVDMMRSLIGQLITLLKTKDKNEKNKKDLELDFDKKLLQKVEAGNLRSLLEFLGQIIDHFPDGTTIYCILDHITAYLSLDMVSDTGRVIQELIRVGETRRGKVNMKLLMTSPRGRSIISDTDDEGLVMVDKILKVPKDIGL